MAEQCSRTAQAEVARFSKLLGVGLPDCAIIEPTDERGVLAYGGNALGRTHVVRFDQDGKYYRHNQCGLEAFSSSEYEACKFYFPVLQGSIDPRKVAKARRILLNKKHVK